MSHDRYPDLPALFALMRARPGVYFGQKSVHSMHVFLEAFRFAEHLYRVDWRDRLGGFDRQGFEQWVSRRYNPERLSLGSFGMAARVAGADDTGFDLWFQWYDEFAATTTREEKPIRVRLRKGETVEGVLTAFTWQESGNELRVETVRWECPCGFPNSRDTRPEETSSGEVDGTCYCGGCCDRQSMTRLEAGKFVQND
jgi:hypothetical protein